MAARDDSRRDAEYDDIAHGHGEHDDLASGDGAERAGQPEHDGARQPEHDGARQPEDGVREGEDGVRGYGDIVHDGPAYAGMDALMAALLDEPLPEAALRDAEFVASRDAAAADVALLREQLGLIGEALAVTGEDAVAGVPPGRPVAARPGDAAGAETDPGRVPRPAQAPTASVTPLLPRPSRARHALKITFGTLVAAAAASLVLGVGWVVVQAGGGVNSATKSGSGASDESAGRHGGQEDSDGGDSASLTREGYVACARVIVEGTVTEVEPVTGAAQDRITVEVDRWIKPDKGEEHITFPMDHDVDPRLRQGDHVLVGIPGDSAQPDIWTTKEAEIARDRAWIEAALSATGVPTCE